MTTKISGKCLCGAVTYVATGKPVVVAQCHCEECRRLSGTGHTVGAMFAAEDVRLHGTWREFQYQSDKGSDVTKAFCATCGSPIFGANTRLQGHITLPLGSMDEAGDLAVEVVIFTRDKPHWDALADDAVSFFTQPDWTPDD